MGSVLGVVRPINETRMARIWDQSLRKPQFDVHKPPADVGQSAVTLKLMGISVVPLRATAPILKPIICVASTSTGPLPACRVSDGFVASVVISTLYLTAFSLRA